MLSKTKLATILSTLKEHPSPIYYLQQYSVSPSIASQILFLAKDDIKDKIVYVLACGTGRFAIGSALMGAKLVYGVDVDRDALEIARKNAEITQLSTGYPITKVCKWIWKDVRKLKKRVDTIIQFPPLINDIIFLKKAFELGKNIYSLHSLSKKKLLEIKEICKNEKLLWFKIKKIGRKFFLVIVKG